MDRKPLFMKKQHIEGDLNGFFSAFLIKKRLEVLKPYLKGKKRILDVGCGIFRMGPLLPSNAEYTGIDFADSIIAYNKSRFNHAFYCLDVEQNSLPDFGKPFDLIIMLAAIEHFADPVPVLMKLKAHLSPDGVIVFTTPHPCGERVLNIGSELGLFSRDKDQHHALMPFGEIKKLSRLAGFDLVAYKRFLFGFNQLAVLTDAK